MAFRCELHSVYGAVLRDGDMVSEGEILGLSADGAGTVTAPCSGTVRLTNSMEGEGRRLYVEIVPSADSPRGLAGEE